MALSIVIPTYNEAIHIEKCISSILTELNNKKIEHEIIVVDNMSTDNTGIIANQFDITFLTCTLKGCPAAVRNLGAQHAKYPIICFIDGDCTLTEKWPDKILELFTQADIGAYGGPCLSPKQGSWVETTWAPIEVASYYNLNATLAGSNMALKKDIFLAVGGFNENLIAAEDDDLSKRILAGGWKVIDDSAHAVIHWGYPNSLEKILKQQIWHGSSQLKAHGLTGDKMVVLTLFWLTALFFLIPTFFIMPAAAGFELAAILSCPLLIAIKRVGRFRKISVSLILKSYVISCFFLAGRSWGLLREVFKN
jgi:glycosyltransferase involved in cell wall biosynthesis